MRAVVRAAAFLTALILVACAQEGPPPPPAGAIPAGETIGTAEIAGRATFTGDVPPPEVISMSSDAACKAAGAERTREDIVVNADGTLRNVFVRVLSGLGGRVFAPRTEPVVLDQKGCVYLPHVFGVQVNQSLDIVNSDPTLHNIHAVPEANKPFNVGMPSQGMRIRKFFPVPEAMVKVKCDLHNWMVAWVGVMDHPFFAVTGDGGTFSLKGLPAGTYEVEAWHETFGRQRATIAVGEGEKKEMDFEFRP